MQAYQSKPINEIYCIVESKLLGKGSTGNVYLGFERNNANSQVAIKAIDLRSIDNQVTRYLLSCQIAALSNLGKLDHSGHENIVKLRDIVIQDQFIYLVMENLSGGTLADYLKKYPQGLPEAQAIFIFKQILEGYCQIRNKKIVHRDLKPDNILFKTNPEVSKRIAIIDFGYCQMEEVPNKPQIFYNVGSPKYMSPEAFKKNQYSEKSDIWALGVILYELLAGKTCDQGMSMQSYLQMIERQGIPLPNHFSPQNKHILSLMLNTSQQNRANGQDIRREINFTRNSFTHQKSEVVLRGSFEQSDLRSTLTIFNPKMDKTNMVFHSLLLPSKDERLIQRTEEHINPRQLRPQSRPPFVKFNPKQSLQLRRSVQVIHEQKSIENVSVNAFKKIVQIKHQPIQNIQDNRQVFVNFYRQPVQQKMYRPNQNMPNQGQFIPKTTPNFFPTQRIQMRNHPNFFVPFQIQPNTLQHPNTFANNQPPIHFQQQNQLQSITNHPRGLNIMVKNPTNTTQHIQTIQQEKKIQFDDNIEVKSPFQKNKIGIDRSQHFTIPYRYHVQIPQNARQIINLKLTSPSGQSKPGLTRLQPQRIVKHTHHNEHLVRQFCV